jgi:hypothetical protein
MNYHKRDETGDYIGPILGRAFYEAARETQERQPEADDSDVIEFVFLEMLVGLIANMNERVGPEDTDDLIRRAHEQAVGDSNSPSVPLQLKPRRGMHE